MVEYRASQLSTLLKIQAKKVCMVPKACIHSLRKEHPEITRAFLRRDNAGCYHSVMVVCVCPLLPRQTGILNKRVDLSDPQGGKGPCDRKAATTKGHVRPYVNEGNDVPTLADFKDAILSHGGVSGVRVALVDTIIDETVATQGKWKGISTLNNFSYTNNGESVTVWRAYNVGKGKTLLLSKVPGENQYEIILNCTTASYKLKIYMVLCSIKIYIRKINIQCFSV